jgi:hypothetical protein
VGAEQIDPRLDEFLRGTFTAEQYELIGDRPLVAMPIAVGGGAAVPDEVLKSWAYLQWDYRRHADQSELSMVAHVLRQGGTWADVAGLLGEPDDRAVQERYAELVVRLSARPPFH